MIWPPLGPGTLASTGAAVRSGVGSGVALGAALTTAAWLGAALGAGVAVDPEHAVTTMATVPASATRARVPDRDLNIAIDSSCSRSLRISYLDE